MQPFTVEHFAKYVANIVLDTGEHWYLEDFQAECVEPIFQGIRSEGIRRGWLPTNGHPVDGGPKEIWAILPEGSAKTTLLAGVALYCADYAPLPWIPIGASARDQAEIMAQQAYQMIRESGMEDVRFHIYEGYRRIQPVREGHPSPGSRGIKVYAAEPRTGDGVIPFPLAILDEGHRHPDMRLYRLWRGKLKKRGAVVVMISTAGEPGTEFEEYRDRIRDSATHRTLKGAHLHAEGPRIVMNEWMVQNPEDISDMEKVKEANPLSATTVEDLAEEFASPLLDMGDWKRLKCNIPARSSSAAVSDVEWGTAYADEEIVEGSHVMLGCDIGWKHDTTAIQPLGYRGEVNGESSWLLDYPQILKPPGDGSMLHVDEVKAAFEDFIDRFVVDTVVMDMSRAQDVAAWLENDKGLQVIDWSQGNRQQAEDYERFMDGLRNGRLRHNGHSGLRAHVMHAVARRLPGDRFVFDRPSQSRARRKQDERVIDCLTAAYMVYSFATAREEGMALPGALEDYHIELLGV